VSAEGKEETRGQGDESNGAHLSHQGNNTRNYNRKMKKEWERWSIGGKGRREVGKQETIAKFNGKFGRRQAKERMQKTESQFRTVGCSPALDVE